MIGQVVAGKYHLLEVLGKGGMAEVYRAQELFSERQVAIKLPRGDYLRGDPEGLERLGREARAIQKLDHPNIVRLLDWGQGEQGDYLVMELVEGESLRQRLDRGGPLPCDEAVGLVAQVLEALSAAHRAGLVHRDISAGNVLVDAAGRVKVTDFGIARATDERTLTQTGAMIGSVHYMSPEQARGEAVGPASDLYSVGILLFELVTGRKPFESDNPVKLALKHVREEPPSPARWRPDLPKNVENAVLRALEKEPEQRFASAEAMRQALLEEEVLERTLLRPAVKAVPFPAAQAPPQPLERPSAKPSWRWVAVAVALLLAGLFVVLLEPSEPGTLPVVVQPPVVRSPAAPAPTPATPSASPAPVQPPPPPEPAEPAAVEVPDLRMVPVETAGLRLRDAGFRGRLQVVGVPTSEQPPGIVLRQETDSEGSITLYVSAAP